MEHLCCRAEVKAFSQMLRKFVILCFCVCAYVECTRALFCWCTTESHHTHTHTHTHTHELTHRQTHTLTLTLTPTPTLTHTHLLFREPVQDPQEHCVRQGHVQLKSGGGEIRGRANPDHEWYPRTGDACWLSGCMLSLACLLSVCLAAWLSRCLVC